MMTKRSIICCSRCLCSLSFNDDQMVDTSLFLLFVFLCFNDDRKVDISATAIAATASDAALGSSGAFAAEEASEVRKCVVRCGTV